MISISDFLALTTTRDQGASQIKLATVDPAYVSGDPRVTFDGEDTLTTREYVTLDSYLPQPGDRVLLVRTGNTWLVVGAIGTAIDQITPLQEPPAAQLEKNANQPIDSNTANPVKLTYQVEAYDSHTFADLTSNQFAIPAGWAGLWEFKLGVRWAASGEATTMRVARMKKNGADIVTEQVPNQNSPQGSTSHSLSREVECSAGDIIESFAWQNSGSAINVTTNYGGTFFSARYVRKLIP